MQNKKIVFVSDFNFRGSGYLNISMPLCRGLADKGYDIKAVGLGYTGEEHPFNFSIIPCSSFSDAHAMTNNLFYQWKPDLVIVALDIPYLQQFSSLCKGLGIKMIAITPLENPPLTMSWSYLLQQIDKVFFISQMGTDEALKAGVENAEHLVVGMDTVSWRMRTTDEYVKGREMMGISPDTLVVLTVADNQERKIMRMSLSSFGRKVSIGYWGNGEPLEIFGLLYSLTWCPASCHPSHRVSKANSAPPTPILPFSPYTS